VETDRQALLDLLARRSSTMDLDRAALEIARIEYPDLDAAAGIAELDRLAWAVAERAGDLSDGRRFVEAANSYLFGEASFCGNENDYYNPDNSCLNRVLETKLGIPITLSVMYIEIARRLAKPVHGVGLPYHFLVRYDEPGFTAIIDPFHGGAILDETQCCRLLQVESLDPGLLEPVDRRHIAMRMINNLRGVYFGRRESLKALRVLDLLIAAEPTSPDEHRQRAAALLNERRIAEALTAFQRYLTLAPNAPDRERVEEQMRNIAFWIASRN
jgi:regulator of sirC expression with transglutaminase-like and TPR domain